MNQPAFSKYELQDAQFLHLRDKKNVPYATIAYIVTEKDSNGCIIEAAYSVCSKKDNFSYKTGRAKALSRLEWGWPKCVKVDVYVEDLDKDDKELLQPLIDKLTRK